jgi:uncharacterized protein YijF (DUF1287 family)
VVSFTLVLALLGALPDRGIFPELIGRVELGRPVAAAGYPLAGAWLRVDDKHRLVTLYDGDDPLKLYRMADASANSPLADSTPNAPNRPTAGLDAADARELTAVAGAQPRVVVGAPPRTDDRDGDGIVDRLDILIGAKKLLYNGARYIERYVAIPYPNGDVPRSEGVCSDTVIRALRNAGIDLQKEVHEDILRAPAAYPMVEKVDASINHRRVRTLLPWFVRHWRTLPATERYLPGDVVFFDTFPQREGPDHLGVVSDTIAATGHPMIINNWTEGATDAEMDLLAFVPVTHHFRLPSSSAPATALKSGRSNSR